MIELLDKRDYSKKYFDNGDGSITMHAHNGHIYYRDTDNEFKPVDYTLQDMGTYWQMTKASYRIFIAKDFGENRLIKFRNLYRGANHEIVYEPKLLAWVNSTDLSDIQIFRNQVSVQGVYNQTNNTVRYSDAFGDGIHFEITILRHGFRKEIIIDAKNKLELPPTANHKLVALFKYTGDGLNVTSNDKSRIWNKESYFEETDGFRISEETDVTLQSFISPAVIVDSANNFQGIKVFWKLHNGSLWQAKVLPKSFLTSAVYPVRADTTTSYYGTANDSMLAYIPGAGATWSALRTTSPCTHNGQNTSETAFSRKTSNWEGNWQTYFPVDTSGIPDTDVISSASWFICVKTLYTAKYIELSIAKTNQTDLTTIADYTKDYPATRWGSSFVNKDTSTMSVDSYAEFVLDSNGIANINKTGLSDFGLISRAILENSEPTGWTAGQKGGIAPYLSEQTGTDKDPYLSVTYAPAATDPNINLSDSDTITENITLDNVLGNINPTLSQKATVRIF